MTLRWKTKTQILMVKQMQAGGKLAQVLIPVMFLALAGSGLAQSAPDARESVSGLVFRTGDGLWGPILIYKTGAHYTEEAFDARLQGEVVLSLVIDSSGCPRNIAVVKPLGLGLDERAVQAIETWLWLPAMRNGKSVAVSATIKVGFWILSL
jgi:protein TonB